MTRRLSFDDLVANLYEAVSSGGEFLEPLRLICSWSDVRHAGVVSYDATRPGSLLFSENTLRDSGYPKKYWSTYVHHSPLLAPSRDVPVGRVMTDSDLVDRRLFEKSAFYNEFLRYYDIGYVMATWLARDDHANHGLADLPRSERRGLQRSGASRLQPGRAPRRARPSVARDGRRPKPRDCRAARLPGIAFGRRRSARRRGKGRRNEWQRDRYRLGTSRPVAELRPARLCASGRRPRTVPDAGAIARPRRRRGARRGVDGARARRAVARASAFRHPGVGLRERRSPGRPRSRSIRDAGPRGLPAEQVWAARGLTPAERRIAERLARGETPREICEALCVSGNTLKTHRARIYAKLGVDSQAKLASLARRHPAG